MDNLLNEIRGSDLDYPLFVKQSVRIENVKARIAKLNEQDFLNKRQVKVLVSPPFLNVKNLFIESPELVKKKSEKKIKRYVTRSILKIKSTPKCPEGYIRSLKTGKCIKDRKRKQKINYDSVINILKGLKV